MTRDGEEAEATETAPISEMMRQSGLVVTEGAIEEGAPAAEAEQALLPKLNRLTSKKMMLTKKSTVQCHLNPAT